MRSIKFLAASAVCGTLLMLSSGCAVVSVAASAVSVGVSVGSTAVGVASSVVSGTVSAGSAVLGAVVN